MDQRREVARNAVEHLLFRFIIMSHERTITMVGLTREQRAEKERRLADAKQGAEFGGTAYARNQNELDDRNAIDERKPEWRPSTVLNIDTQEPAPDERQYASDMGKALNQMVGRAAITENADPAPAVTRANNPPAVPNPAGAYQGEGDEVQLLRGYVPLDAPTINGQAEKRIAGEVLRLPSKEAKKLVNMGAAKFTETD